MTPALLRADIAIIGAGPVGLAFAITMAERGLDVVVLERAPQEALAAPRPDGREIALTHRSIAILKRLGAWARLPAAAISPLNTARVLDGGSAYALNFNPDPTEGGPLGMLVANHLIRAALYAAAATRPGLRILAGREAHAPRTGAQSMVVETVGGPKVEASLLVAADTRFSRMRQALSIGADRLDFGTSMLLCPMRHERPHDHVATERFAYGQTIAALPMNGAVLEGGGMDGRTSSIVITRRHAAIQRLAALEAPALAQEVMQGLKHMLGEMQPIGPRYVQPLVSVHARRFVGNRAALIGDAAVGMHPVTALGFNLGLRGQDILAQEIAAGLAEGRDVGDEAALRRYATAHERLTRPLWFGTNVVARLYAAESWPARLARQAALQAANRLPPFRQAVVGLLTDRAPR